MSLAAPVARRLARFELLRELGRGAQATVWLAHDPRLDREVALKLLGPLADAATVGEWLHEARAVSRLAHPNIVPVFEADEAEGQPYLVFEYVEGPTLAQARRGQPPMPARDAVALLLGVLDALAAAHAQGLVHRDLKPSNIMLGSDGRARVMDFGIAARATPDAGLRQLGGAANGNGRKAVALDTATGRKPVAVEVAAGRIVGTPGYISPEAARGEAPVPAMDVFAAGVVLGELLSGAPLLRETDPWRAVERVQHEDMVLPPQPAVDATLRGIVQRALARDVRTRYDSAGALHAALSAWLHPVEAAASDDGGKGSHATLEFLLRRMRHKTDFPALSASVVRIQRVATSETESQRSLADEILKDVALTNKLLRMVNTAHFTAAAGGGVGTVSRAVALVGFAGIRNMALSVLLLEHMGDKVHAAQLKEEFLRALMAGTLAEALSPLAREGEEAFLGAMFQNLGRLLTECYFPEEALQIRQQLKRSHATPAERDRAAHKVLGLGLGDLGAGVAKAWGLPDRLQRALRAPDGDVPARAVDRAADGGVERMRWLGRSANALADALLSADGAAQADALLRTAEHVAPVLGMPAARVVDAAQAARTRVTQLAQALGVQLAAGAPARRLLQATEAPPAAAQAPAAAAFDQTLAVPGCRAPQAQAQAQTVLNQVLDGLRTAAEGKALRLNDVLHRVLDGLQRALDFRCVILCLRDPASGHLVGRVGVGPAAAEFSAAFRIAPDGAAGGDLFAALCAKGADLLISNAAQVAGRLPPWYRQRINAPTFLLLPLMLKGAPIGLIYADKAQAGAIVLHDGDLALVRALRDHAAAAFAKAG